MQVSTEVKTHVIVFFDGTHKFITEGQADFIIVDSLGSAKGCKIGDCFYNYADIRKIITLQEFHEQYPEKQEAEKRPEYVVPKVEYVPLEKQAEKRQSAFRGLLQGLKQFIDEELIKGRKPPQAIVFYKEKLEKYKILFALDKQLQEIAASFGGEIIN